METKIIEPTEYAQQITRDIVKQNELIILQNERILRALLNPLVVVNED